MDAMNKSKMKKKQVLCIVEDIPSYLGHILSVSRVGFESDYSDKYSSTIEPADAKWLKENEDVFKWGNGKAGSLTGYGLFILGFVNPDGTDGIESYFDALISLIDTGNCDQMLRNFPSLIRFHEQWGPLDHPDAIEMLKSNRENIVRFSKILCRNWENFEKDVWPNEKDTVSAKAAEINKKLEKVDSIARWENATGFPFNYEKYEYILSSGMKNAPRFNSLGYGKNWVYYDIPLLFEGILHEVGSHVLIDLHRELRGEYEDFFLLYNVRETLCSHLTKMMFSDFNVELTPLDGSKVYDARADELFREKITSLPVSNVRKEFREVLDQINEERQKNA